MIELLTAYWESMALAILLTSLFLSVLNRFSKMERIHDGWLVLGLSVLSTVLTASFTKITSFADVQALAIRFLITVAFCYLFSITRGQQLVDRALEWVAGRFDKNAKPPDPPAIP